MATTPRGMTVTEAYRHFRDDKLVVNRTYQRKLVWTTDEKRKLVDSILKGYPIPLLLLLQRGDGRLEIIDGMQRLNAILTFIENGYSDKDGSYFDVSEFPTSKQYASEGLFNVVKDEKLLSRQECAAILDYQLAVTIFSVAEASDVTDIFGRINSGGKQLSPQEQRQAGVVFPFAKLVRKVSSELRGDASAELVNLSEMPLVSIDGPSLKLGYGVHADATFWCKHGVLSIKELRDSVDEQMIADLAASILLESPLAASRERFDEAYDSQTSLYKELQDRLSAYGEQNLADEIKAVFSVLVEIVEGVDPSANSFRRTIAPSNRGNPVRTPFYAVFMALHKLLIRDEKQPTNYHAIMQALSGYASQLHAGTHHVTVEDRNKNIAVTIGLIQNFFTHKDPPLLGHGPGLAVDFENSLRRSRIETPRYEFKQGLLRLDNKRNLDPEIIPKISRTACGIGNIGPSSNGFIFIGVADKEEDADRINKLDGVIPIVVDRTWVVGIDREAKCLGITIEQYVRNIVEKIRNSELSDDLKRGLLAHVDTIVYRGLTVIRITVPQQNQVGWLGETTFDRQGSETIEATGKAIAAISARFSK